MVSMARARGTAGTVGVRQVGEDPGLIFRGRREAVEDGGSLQELLRFGKAALVFAERAHEIVHSRNDLRGCDAVLIHDLPGQREKILGLAVLVLGSAGIAHGSGGQNVEVVELRCSRVPVRHRPGQFGEVEGLGGLAGEAPAALVQQKAHQTRAAEAASGSREPACARLEREGQNLFQILAGVSQLSRRGGQPSRDEQGERLKESAPAGRIGLPAKEERLGLGSTVGTTGEEVIGLDLFQEVSGKLPPLDGLVQLARDVDIVHRCGGG